MSPQAEKLRAKIKKLQHELAEELRHTPPRRKAKPSYDSWDRFDSRDPQIPDQRFVRLDDEHHLALEDDLPDYDRDEVVDPHDQEADDPRDKTLRALKKLWDPDMPFTLQERAVLTRRLLRQDTYQDIARTTRGLSGPSQVQRIEERAVKKLARHYSKHSNDL
jgi:hypothetical protein